MLSWETPGSLGRVERVAWRGCVTRNLEPEVASGPAPVGPSPPASPPPPRPPAPLLAGGLDEVGRAGATLLLQALLLGQPG